MFEEPKRLSPTHKNNSSNTIVQNKTLNNIPMSLSKNSAIQNRVGFINPDRPQIIDYKGTNQRLGNVLQQKSIMPRKELNDNRYLNEQMGCKQLKANMFTKGDNQASNIIQRKIGFEFQTNCKITKNKFDDKQQIIPDERTLNKQAKITEGDFVEVVVDDNNNKYSDVEFVTKPLENYDDLIKANATMKTLWDNLKNNYVEKKEKIHCDGEDCTLFMGDKEELHGNPQVTFGTSLANIKAIADAAIKIKQDANNRMPVGAKKHPTKRLEKVKDTKTNFEGLIELIKSYLRLSLYYTIKSEKIAYPKKITDSFLLARTDFATLYNLCKKPKDYTIEKWVKKFEDDGFKNHLNERLIPTTTDESKADHIIKEYDKITIREWLKGIYNGADHLKGITDQESMSKFESEEIPYYYKENKELKNVKKPVGIFELRGNQGVKHYLKGTPSWLTFMKDWYKVIEETGYLPPSSIAPRPPIAPLSTIDRPKYWETLPPIAPK